MTQFNPLVELLYRAFDAQVGIAVSVSDPDRARAKFYQARKDALNPAFEDIAIVPSRTNPTGELWLLRKSFQSNEEPSANGSA